MVSEAWPPRRILEVEALCAGSQMPLKCRWRCWMVGPVNQKAGFFAVIDGKRSVAAKADLGSRSIMRGKPDATEICVAMLDGRAGDPEGRILCRLGFDTRQREFGG